MKLKRRCKSSRFRGSHTHGRGFKKKARGSGHQGGKGMAGTGKRADQKKTLILNLPEKYFGKSKTLRRGKVAPKLQSINISKIVQNLPSLIKKQIAKEIKGECEVNLTGYKVLSDGEVTQKLIIHCNAVSEKAKSKIEKAGGKVIIVEEETD
jgi:large subunit ribosomal protein L15